uniref:Ig-like domain-containing protein n=1 Tax=Ciona savignyi TaxID=51511 RepID=H2Y9I5_CIOSA
MLFIPVIYASSSNSPQSCHPRCQCLQGVRVNCTAAGFVTLDPDIPRTFRDYEFDQNKLTALDKTTFSGLTSAAHLRVDRNQITVVSARAFNHNPLLSQLFLDYNQITTLPPTLFSNNRELTIFSAKNNNITSISGTLFKHCPKLRFIGLSDNHISTIAPKAFLSNLQLTRLYLDNNRLTTPLWKWIGHFNHSGNSFELYMEGNPWSCDCLMSDFLLKEVSSSWFRVAERNRVGRVSKIQCDYPYHGQYVESVDSHRLVCVPPTIHSNTSVVLVEGKPGVVTCTADGTPKPLVWFTDETGRNVTKPQRGNTSMTFTSVIPDEAGRYKCVASGMSQQKVRVQEIQTVTIVVKSKPSTGIVVFLVLLLVAIVFGGVFMYFRHWKSRRAGYGSLSDDTPTHYDITDESNVTQATRLTEDSEDEMVSYERDTTDEREVLV